MVAVKIKQYALFVIYSDTLEPDEISRRVGLAADEVALKASRIKDPPRPVTNIWKLRSDTRGLTVDDHIELLIERLGPFKSAIRALVDAQDGVKTRLEVVRYFGAEDGEEEVIDVVDGLEKLAGQHQLLGWELKRDVLEFVCDVDADLWVDEYG
jgi:Domain of unknown function (DUF4279)